MSQPEQTTTWIFYLLNIHRMLTLLRQSTSQMDPPCHITWTYHQAAFDPIWANSLTHTWQDIFNYSLARALGPRLFQLFYCCSLHTLALTVFMNQKKKKKTWWNSSHEPQPEVHKAAVVRGLSLLFLFDVEEFRFMGCIWSNAFCDDI